MLIAGRFRRYLVIAARSSGQGLLTPTHSRRSGWPAGTGHSAPYASFETACLNPPNRMENRSSQFDWPVVVMNGFQSVAVAFGY